MNRLKNKQKTSEFEKPSLPIDKVANADNVIGQSIMTVSGIQVIPLTSVTIVNIGGSGEYGDIKTYKINEGFKLAGGNGTVVTIKPKGFLVDDGKGCRLLKMEDEPLNAIIDKTSELVQNITNNQ